MRLVSSSDPAAVPCAEAKRLIAEQLVLANVVPGARAIKARPCRPPAGSMEMRREVTRGYGGRLLLGISGPFPTSRAWIISGSKADEQKLILGELQSRPVSSEPKAVCTPTKAFLAAEKLGLAPGER